MNPWLPWGLPQSPKKVVLCLSHAGGAASSYRDWRVDEDSHVEFVPVELPGRETRYAEPFQREFDEVVIGLANAVIETGLKEVSLFGHSMGALLGYETAHLLTRLGVKIPMLAVSAHAPPAVEGGQQTKYLENLSDEDIAETLRELGGTAQEILRHPLMLEILVSRFRADCAIVNSRKPRNLPRIPTDLVVIGGQEDLLVPPKKLLGWENLVDGSCSVHIYKGDHFYLRDHGASLRKLLSRKLLDI